MSCVVRWWDVKGMHFSSKNARLVNLLICRIIRILHDFFKLMYRLDLKIGIV